jgi:uncharacterized protein YdeI (YjbR/CyaY-like superfamily)
MKIGKTLYVKNRQAWRLWLEKNHSKKKEIWLIYYKKHTGKSRIPYNDAVEEALCYGWIDSIAKTVDDERFAQRFTPRKKESSVSDLNIERIRKLIANGSMTSAGMETVKNTKINGRFKIPEDIENIMKNNHDVWENFIKFPIYYKRVRIAWIESSRSRPEIFQKRLSYFIKMTEKNKRFGMMQ